MVTLAGITKLKSLIMFLEGSKMFLRGIKRKDVAFIIECLRWNKYRYSQYIPERCGTYKNKRELLDEVSDVQRKLKEAINE